MLRFISVNTRGIRDKVKRKAVMEKHRFNADFLVLQETHSTEHDSKQWENEWGGRGIFAHGNSMARGILVLMSKELYTCVENIETDQEGRLIIFDVVQNQFRISIAAVYAPNQDSPAFFNTIRKKFELRSEHKILIGDLNLVMDVSIDRNNTYNNNNKAMEEVVNMCDQYCMVDIWRVRNPDVRQFSWFKSGNLNVASRIDLALITSGLDQYVEMIYYLSSIKTDHRAIYLVVNLTSGERGTGYWKLNTSLLQDQEYVSKINEEIDLCIKSLNTRSAKSKWEKVKERVKKATVRFSKCRASNNSLVISQLSEIVNEYEASLPLPENETKLLLETKQDLEDKLMEKAKGQIFRCKARWYELGEKNTKYFYNLEKAKYNAKTCYKLIDQDGTEIVNPEKILSAQKQFYEELYAEDPEVSFTMENKYDIFVPEEIKQQQDSQITMLDLETAIKGMNNNRTPGEDGLPVEFYKVFWSHIKDIFYDMVLEAYQDAHLHSTALKGILNLIPKPGKDTRFIKNLRPITLLNVDYKIIEKSIANKMLPALDHIIHRDQRGFMKDRRISVNIRKMLDIMFTAEEEDIEAVVLSLDFVKCFDKCSFSILHGSLDFFGFGQIIKDWTKILYHDFTVKVQNNGHFSSPLAIHKGVHQGGCCSSVYFLVIAEILALALRDNDRIDGITIQDIRHLLNQFADDMDIATLCNETSIRNIYSELNQFRLQSGFTVSYDKTTLYRIGSLRHSDAQMYSLDQFIWSNKDINVLGVTIAHEELVDKNYLPLLQKVKTVLNAWYNRGLSLIAKIQVVNTLVASLFVYKMMVLPAMPRNIEKCIDNIIREFIWNGKKAKIAYRILQNPKKQGGLNLVNLRHKDTALKATWPQILSQEDDYSSLVYKILRCTTLGENIWRCRICPTDVKQLKIKNQFWEDVVIAWCQYNYYKNYRIDNQILWYNSNIKISGNIFYWKDAQQKGLMYIHQLFEQQRYISYQEMENKFGISKLRYNSLKAAIPKDIRDYFLENSLAQIFPLSPSNYDTAIILRRSLSRQVYQSLSDDAMIMHSKYIKWKQDLGSDFCPGIYEFGLMHLDIYKVTNIAKYRSFQYRLLQRALVTNVELEHWKMRDNNLCSFCHEYKETQVHLFYECQIVREVWKRFEIYLRGKFSIQHMETSKENILLNTAVKRKNHVANFLILVFKQYIYRQRCLNKDIIFHELINEIRTLERIEKYIAMKNGKLELHDKKWGIVNQVNGTHNLLDQNGLNSYINQYIHNLT